ncbi:MAG: hypothetical protein WAK50_16160 [Nitrososphaeraceae archaeon]
MESVRLNMANDLLQSTELASNTIENNTILQPIDKVYFVICNSCYWCASYFGIDDLESLSGSSSHVLDCHVCNSHNTELMPISNDESFRIEYGLTRGMELEFYKSNKIVPRQESVNEQYVSALIRPG